MKLFLERLTSDPTSLEYEAPARWWLDRVRESREEPLEVLQAFAFALQAHRMGEDVYCEGKLDGEVRIECSRCGSRYPQGLRESFRLVLEPARDRIPSDPEGADALARTGLCLGDEIEAGWFRGTEITLDDYFAELVALGLPVQPVCRAECKGLCPVCGVNRNAAGCDCEEEADERESPFAVLATLRDELQGD